MSRAHATAKRGDIQGLRAIAVALVLVYHFFPDLIPGGFVGVDVFFVISGFLITLLLLKELDRTDRISLSKFYARRIRRLLPASLTVTIATVLVGTRIYGPFDMAHMFEDAAWSTAYLANYHLAQSPEGYFAASSPSLFTHFWSLAVEEQYYLVWPLVLLVLALVARKRWRRVAPIVLGIVLIVSLIASIVLTADGSNDAYYSLGTRAWELAIGGTVAFLVFSGRRPATASVALGLSLVGVAAIILAAFLYTQATPFPGWTAAVPTIGTALVIWAGSHQQGLIARILGFKPLAFVGDISYSLYLWHWPVLIFGVIFFGPSGRVKLALIALSVLLAIATYFGVERGVSRIRQSTKPRVVVAVGLTLTLVVVVGMAASAGRFPTTGGPAVEPGEALHVDADIREGALLLSRSPSLATPAWVPANVTPSLEKLPADLASVFFDCMGLKATTCEGGDPNGDTTIVLVGDSQAGHWWPAADAAAKANGWKLYGVGKSGCPVADVPMTPEQETAESPGCGDWRETAVQQARDLKPDLILFANRGYGYGVTDPKNMTSTEIEDWNIGIAKSVDELTDEAPTVYFGRFPTVSVNIGACLYANLKDVAVCTTPVDQALPPSARERDIATAAGGGAVYFDPSTVVCANVCPVLDANRIMYRDSGHLTATYSRHLEPVIAAVVESTLASYR